MSTFLRRTWAEVDVDAVKNNYRKIRQAVGPETQIMCVIKADAYGHGAVFLAKLYEKMGADRFAVSNIEEAMQLRENGIRLPVLILGFTPAGMARELADNNISQAVFSEEYARELSKAAGEQKVNVKIHIKLDTGMSRIGITPDDSGMEFIRRVLELHKDGSVILEGIFTHFSRADETSLDHTRTQIRRFSAFTKRIEEELGYRIPLQHASNSAGIIRLPEANFDLVRAGITLYGLWPSSDVPREPVPLRPVMSLHSHVVYVKTLPADSQISYGGTYVTQKDERIATIPVGYGDGYPRSLSNKGYVLIRGQKAPIRGRVCMDQMMVDVTHIPDVQEGDLVTLIGKDHDRAITMEELGDMSGRFNYELACDISPRVPRVFIDD